MVVAPGHASKQRYWYASYAVVNVGVVYVAVVPPLPSVTSDHEAPDVIDTCHWNVISPASLSDVVAATPNCSVPPTAPVVPVGCAVILIVLVTKLLATAVVALDAPEADITQRYYSP